MLFLKDGDFTLKKLSFAAMVCFISAANFTSTAQAELFVNPIGKNKVDHAHVSVHFKTVSVDYEAASLTGEIDRTLLGATYVHGFDSTFDVFGTASFILESELEGALNDGDGYLVGGGFRTNLLNDLDLDLSSYAQLLYISEDYGNSIDGDETTLLLGVAASKALDNYITVYGAVEFNLWSDLDLEGLDADRDDLFGFRVGANLKQGQYLLNANLALGHETGLYIGGSKAF